VEKTSKSISAGADFFVKKIQQCTQGKDSDVT